MIFDNPDQPAILAQFKMNTTFAKQVKMHASVNGWTAILPQRCRLLGVVGTKP
jgi:hypothetical protein